MRHQLFSDKLTVSINSQGAELCSVINKNGLEFIWPAKKEIWARHAPLLFPIVGKLKNNLYSFKEKKYELSQHGFARDMEFDLKHKSQNSCCFQLKQNDVTLSKFPFEFVLEIEYSLVEDTLFVAYNVKNHSANYLFFSIGAHPAFNIPLNKEELFEDYYLQFNTSVFSRTELVDGLVSNNKVQVVFQNNQLSLNANLFDKDALVFENEQIDEISLKSRKSKHKIELKCKNWPFFGIWSKKGCNEFVCLEPWFGVADSVNSNQELTKKKGIIALEAQKNFNCQYSLSFQ